MKQSTKIIIAGLFVILLAVVLIVVFFFLPRNEDNSLIRPKTLYALNTDEDRKSTRLNSSHNNQSRMPSSA